MNNANQIAQQILAYHLMASCTNTVGMAMWRAAMRKIQKQH